MTKQITNKIINRKDAYLANKTSSQPGEMSFRVNARNLNALISSLRKISPGVYPEQNRRGRNDMKKNYDKVSNTGKVFQNLGFTLVEILIAIFILGLVMATVYVSYSGILKVSHEMSEENNIYKMARTSLNRMIKDLSSLQTDAGSFDFHAEKRPLNNREFYYLSFWSASHLAFSENDEDGRPATISYYVKEDEDGDTFSLWRSDVASAKPEKEKKQTGEFLICRNIDSWKLRFYDSTGNELDSWDSSALNNQKGKAPTVVKIELVMTNLKDKEKPYKFTTKVFLPVKK